MAKVVSADLLKAKLMNMSHKSYVQVPYIQTPYTHDVNSMAQYMTSIISQEVSRNVDTAMRSMLMELWLAIESSTIDSGCIICREPSDHERDVYGDVIGN